LYSRTCASTPPRPRHTRNSSQRRRRLDIAKLKEIVEILDKNNQMTETFTAILTKIDRHQISKIDTPTHTIKLMPTIVIDLPLTIILDNRSRSRSRDPPAAFPIRNE